MKIMMPVETGATMIDVGITISGAITPVPGGVRPMTIACLLKNTLTACCHAHHLSKSALLGASQGA